MKINKQITIDVPDGYIIDEEKSSLKDGNVVFKKIEILLPKSWEEVKIKPSLRYTGFPKRYESLFKLEILRDIYRQGWKPDLKNINMIKYVIYNSQNKLATDSLVGFNCFLSFQSKEIRNEFLKNFRDLIEECKDFI